MGTGEKKRLLLMDDEEIVRKVMVLMLERSGFEVEAVVDGSEAVRKWSVAAERGRPFDLGIFDLTIPTGLGGEEAGKMILAGDPNARIVLSSGYSSHPIVAEYPLFGFKGVIIKPFRLEELLRVIDASL